jgi:hypothetical protein
VGTALSDFCPGVNAEPVISGLAGKAPALVGDFWECRRELDVSLAATGESLGKWRPNSSLARSIGGSSEVGSSVEGL